MRKLHGAAKAAHEARLRRRWQRAHGGTGLPPTRRHSKRSYRRRKHVIRARLGGGTAARLARRNVGRFIGY